MTHVCVSRNNQILSCVLFVVNYGLGLQTLLKHTEECHSDLRNLVEAQQAVHDLAVTINLGQRSSRGISQELSQIEALIEGLAGLASPDRSFLSHDQVSLSTLQYLLAPA